MIAVLVFVSLAILFGVTYYLNARTPVPEGCEERKESCRGCQIKACMNRVKEESE